MGSGNLLLTILTAFALGIGAGIMGTVYRTILAYEPVLSWWFQFGARYEGKWFFAPVWGCYLCISGQLALWFYAGLVILPAWIGKGWLIFTIWHWDAQTYGLYFTGLFGLILAISCAVGTAFFLGHAINSKNK